jgi:hypothetical protein
MNESSFRGRTADGGNVPASAPALKRSLSGTLTHHVQTCDSSGFRRIRG